MLRRRPHPSLKQKAMKKYVLAILISFLAVAFVIGNLDPMQWEMNQRAGVVFLSVFSCLMIFLFQFTKKTDQ